MRKKFAASTAAFIVIVAGLLFNNLGSISDTPVNKDNDIIKAPGELLKVNKEGVAANKFINAVVTDTVDGDTLEVSYKNKTYKVRLLDVDTPESVKRGVKVQPYGKEASEFTRKTVLDKKVKLVFEKGVRDRYGRLLAHVILENGEYLNAMLVCNGYARVEIVSPNRAFKDYFYDLLDTAVSGKKGLWGLPEDQRPFKKNSKGEYVPKYWSNQKAA